MFICTLYIIYIVFVHVCIRHIHGVCTFIYIVSLFVCLHVYILDKTLILTGNWALRKRFEGGDIKKTVVAFLNFSCICVLFYIFNVTLQNMIASL